MRQALFPVATALSCAIFPPPAPAADEVDPPVARCTFVNREITLSPWGWAGVHWQEAGEVIPAGFASGAGFGGDVVSVMKTDTRTVTVLTYDLRRKERNAVMAFTFASDSTLAGGTAEGQCEALQ